jgi:hypothetical protein
MTLSLQRPNGVKMKVVKMWFNCAESTVVAISSNCLFTWNAITAQPIGAYADASFTDHSSSRLGSAGRRSGTR